MSKINKLHGADEYIGVRGHIAMITTDKETGKVLDTYSEDNVITVQGFSQMVKRLTFVDSNSQITNSYFHNFTLGIDVGSGTLLNPQQPTEFLTSANQTVVYAVPNSDMVYEYPNSKVFRFRTILDGDEIMNTVFPSEIEMRYTSATLRFGNGVTFSYKRFPVRSLSRLVDIEIIWTITFA
jgi:hypothetical protein